MSVLENSVSTYNYLFVSQCNIKSPSVLHVSGGNFACDLTKIICGFRLFKNKKMLYHLENFVLFYFTVKIIMPSTGMSLDVRKILHNCKFQT